MKKLFLMSVLLIIVFFSSLVLAQVTGKFTITGKAAENQEPIFSILKDFFRKILASPVYGRFEVPETKTSTGGGEGGESGGGDGGKPPAPYNKTAENETEIEEIPEKKPEIISIFKNRFLILLLLILLIILVIISLIRKKSKKKR